MPDRGRVSSFHASFAGILTWWVPGLGHIYLGHRKRGIVLLVTVTATFWSGVAIGGVRETVDPQKHKLWFVAQLCTGGNTVFAYMLNRRATLNSERAATPVQPRHWLSADIGVHYTGIAGLLNVLVILDALFRAESPSYPRRGGQATQPAGP